MKRELRHLAILGGAALAVGVSSVAVANDPIVFDNIPAGYNLYSAMSSQLSSIYRFDSQTADDFILKSDMFITGVNWFGAFFRPGDPTPPDAFNILIYADAGGVPTGGPGDPSGTALASYTLLPGDWTTVDTGDGIHFEYSAKLPGPFVATGGVTYWLAVQAVVEFPPQWGINSSTTEQGNQNVIGFPLLGIPYWSLGGNVFGSTRDNAFQLTGVIPAPGALALLGIAGVAGMRRHRRK